MARLSPSQHKPILGFRMKLQVSSLPQAYIYCKSFALPSIDNSTVTAEYGNTQMKLKGKTKWQTLPITCYQYEGITITEFWQWMQEHQQTDDGVDQYADIYKHDITLNVMAPNGFQPVHQFTLVGGFIGTAEFGQFDWASEDIVEMSVNLEYDYAKKTL